MDKIAGTAGIFFAIILVGYLIVFTFQYKNMTNETERLTILVTRTALFLPLYALCLLISVARPEALGALQIPIAFVEGYSFYCFLTVLVTNLGGPEKAVEALQGRPLICCTSCCPTEPDKFYNKVVWAVFFLHHMAPIRSYFGNHLRLCQGQNRETSLFPLYSIGICAFGSLYPSLCALLRSCLCKELKFERCLKGYVAEVQCWFNCFARYY